MNVVIVGAGPVGLLLAHRLLARSPHYQVFLYEQRSDPRLQRSDERAFVISLTERGQQILKAMGRFMSIQGKLSQRFPNEFSPTPATLVTKTTLLYATIFDRIKPWMALIRWSNQRSLAKRELT